MPIGLVTSPEEEICWERSKEIATAHFGHPPRSSQEWAYTMGIYKHMCMVLEPSEEVEIEEEEIVVRLPRRKRRKRAKTRAQ